MTRAMCQPKPRRLPSQTARQELETRLAGVAGATAGEPNCPATNQSPDFARKPRARVRSNAPIAAGRRLPPSAPHWARGNAANGGNFLQVIHLRLSDTEPFEMAREPKLSGSRFAKPQCRTPTQWQGRQPSGESSLRFDPNGVPCAAPA